MKGNIEWLIVVLRVVQAAIAVLLGVLIGEQAALPGVEPGSVVVPELLRAARLFVL